MTGAPLADVVTDIPSGKFNARMMSTAVLIDRYVMEVSEMEDRFEFVEKNGVMQGTRIIVDKETGVQYLLAHWTNIGGLTVLVDKDGKPMLDPRYAK